MLTEVEKPGFASRAKKLQASHIPDDNNMTPISYSNGSS